MKKLLTILLTTGIVSNVCASGRSWYNTYINSTNNVIVFSHTSDKCWYPYDYEQGGYILPNNSKTFHSQEAITLFTCDNTNTHRFLNLNLVVNNQEHLLQLERIGNNMEAYGRCYIKLDGEIKREEKCPEEVNWDYTFTQDSNGNFDIIADIK